MGTVYDFQGPQTLVREYDIETLEDSSNNYFHGMEGEKWQEFVCSIREYGVISPLIIREKTGSEGKYEILAGHNRRRGAAEAGLTTVPCIPVDVDDVDASVLIGITNRQREEISDLEWGLTYRTTLEKLKLRGSREAASSPEERAVGERSIDIVARKYGVSRKTVQRKIRLTYLIPQLYDLGQKMNYSQKMLVSLSYLPPVAQVNVVQAVVIERLSLTESLAERLRKAASDSELTINEILRLCRSQADKKQADEGSPRPRKYEIAESLFPAGLAKGRRQEYVTAALTYLLEHPGEFEFR